MSKLSVLILTKNEEKNISECLKSVSFADEKVVIDAESSDKTVELAKKGGAKVYVHHFINFAEQRNFALSLSKGDWLLYVDADERVTPSLRDEIKNKVLKIKNQEIAAYKILRKNFYLGNHEWPYVEKLERLFKREKLLGWHGELHESPKIKGKVGELDGFLLHFTHRDLSSMVAKTIEWSEIEANLRIKAGHPKMAWWRFPRVMIPTFFNYYFKQKGFKLGTVGLIESIYQVFSIFITYARLWEKQHEKDL